MDLKKCHETRDELRESLQQFNEHFKQLKDHNIVSEKSNQLTDGARTLQELHLKFIEHACKLIESGETGKSLNDLQAKFQEEYRRIAEKLPF